MNSLNINNIPMLLIFMTQHLNCYSCAKSSCVAYISKPVKLCILFALVTLFRRIYFFKNVYKILAIEVFITLLFIIFENMKTYSRQD